MSETTTEQQEVAALLESAQIMYVTINGVFELHAPNDKGEDVICEHCSGLGDKDISYPCSTAAILLADMVLDDATETSELAESEELSS